MKRKQPKAATSYVTKAKARRFRREGRPGPVFPVALAVAKKHVDRFTIGPPVDVPIPLSGMAIKRRVMRALRMAGKTWPNVPSDTYADIGLTMTGGLGGVHNIVWEAGGQKYSEPLTVKTRAALVRDLGKCNPAWVLLVPEIAAAMPAPLLTLTRARKGKTKC